MASADKKSLFQAVETESVKSVSDVIHEISQKPETSLRSIIDQRNEQNQTVLHISCSKLLVDITRLLLEVGADPNAQDVDGRTPALAVILRIKECNCEDCTKKASRCLTAIAGHGGSLDIPDENGYTPLYLCAEYGFSECAKVLLENGAAVGTQKGRPMVEILVEKVPVVLGTVFDRAVKVKGNKSLQDPDCELTFDLGVILPAQITLSNQLHNSNGSMNQVFPAEKWFSENYEACEEMEFLKQLLNFSENDSLTYRSLLRHPLVNVFTDIKWKSLETIYYMFLFMQIKVLLAYSGFICAAIFLDCPYALYMQLQQGVGKINVDRFTNGVFNATDYINADSLCEIGLISKTLSIFVVVCTFINLIKEVQHALYDIKEYVKDVFNFFQLVGFASVIYTVVVAWNPSSPLYALLYPVAAFGITVSWCQLFVQIGRLPQLAIYVEMFVKISVNFCWSLFMYSTLLIGFAFSFSILFPAKPRLLDIPISIIQVLTMMNGELNYDGLFGENSVDEGGKKSLENDTNTTSKYSLKHRFSGHVWYFMFVVFITLVLMNLLVGLAVSDIQGIKKNAEIYVIKRRIRYIAYLEKSLYEMTSFVPNFFRKFLRENVAIAKPTQSANFLCFLNFLSTPVELKNCKLTVRPNRQSESLLSNESKMSIKHWYVSKMTSGVAGKCKGNQTTSGFRQRTYGNFRKGSSASLIGQNKLFMRDTSQQTDTERLIKLEFNVHQMDNKLNELDVKLDMILKTMMRPDTPTDVV